MPVPDKHEFERRIERGITMRESELWIADECEHAAALLRKEEQGGTKEIAINSVEAFCAMLLRIVHSIKE